MHTVSTVLLSVCSAQCIILLSSLSPRECHTPCLFPPLRFNALGNKNNYGTKANTRFDQNDLTYLDRFQPCTPKLSVAILQK